MIAVLGRSRSRGDVRVGRFDFEKIRLGNFAFVREAPRHEVRPQCDEAKPLMALV